MKKKLLEHVKAGISCYFKDGIPVSVDDFEKAKEARGWNRVSPKDP